MEISLKFFFPPIVSRHVNRFLMPEMSVLITPTHMRFLLRLSSLRPSLLISEWARKTVSIKTIFLLNILLSHIIFNNFIFLLKSLDDKIIFQICISASAHFSRSPTASLAIRTHVGRGGLVFYSVSDDRKNNIEKRTICLRRLRLVIFYSIVSVAVLTLKGFFLRVLFINFLNITSLKNS